MNLDQLLDRLKMDHLQAALDALCEHASKKDLNYREFLEQALAQEWGGRHQKGLDTRLVRELSGLGFVERNENVILLGPPGVGKTHLAVALGVKAAEAGHRVLFMTLDRLVSTLVKARQENRLDRQLQQLTYPKVLVLDEIGYLPMTREEASLFFRLINRRYERASTILTSNKSFMDWGEVFGDQVIATAILDRLLHHSTTLNIKGESYRLKDKRKAGLVPGTNLQQEDSDTTDTQKLDTEN